jgi:hypothetical protein
MEKGVLGTKLETAIQLLSKKFGFLPEELRLKLQKAAANTLSLILNNIFDLASWEYGTQVGRRDVFPVPTALRHASGTIVPCPYRFIF